MLVNSYRSVIGIVWNLFETKRLIVKLNYNWSVFKVGDCHI